MVVSGRTTHMYKKYGIRVTQDAVTEESKSSNYREILFLSVNTKFGNIIFLRSPLSPFTRLHRVGRISRPLLERRNIYSHVAKS